MNVSPINITAMNKNIIALCLLPAAAIGLAACSDNEDVNGGDAKVEARYVYDSGCKTDAETSEAARANGGFENYGFEESVEYTSKGDGYVFVNHVNSILQCCSDEKRVDVTRSGNVISVREYDPVTSCNCLCPFDIQYEIGPLTPGEYTVTFVNNNASFTFTYPSSGTAKPTVPAGAEG